MTLTFGSLFAGIGGFDLGFERAGMVCKWQVEKDPFCLKILAKHWPNVERFEDVKEVGKHNLRAVDVICGGFPCQPHSLAGKRKASEDERDLWGEFARIIGEIKPQWVVAENVSGLLTSENGRFFGRVLRDLAEMGYDAEWSSIEASNFGAPHKRERVFLLAYPAGKRRNILHDKKNVILQGNGISNFVQSGYRWERKNGGHSPEYVGWDVTPPVRGSYDGIPAELDEPKHRLKSLGNAVVPQVAEFIGGLIVEFDNSGEVAK